MQSNLPLVRIFVFLAIYVAVLAAVFYFLRRWMAKRLPAPVRRRGQLNFLICVVGVLAVLALLTAAIWVIFKQPIRSSAKIAFGIFWIFIFTVFFVGWLYPKSTAGPLLLDCGPHPMKNIFLFNAAVSLLVFGGGGLARFGDKFDTFGFATMFFGFTFTIYSLVLASGRLQIRENGIWQYWSLLKWDRLQSFKWEGDSLLLRVKTRFPFLGRGALPVPAEHKESIEQSLRQHCPTAIDA